MPNPRLAALKLPDLSGGTCVMNKKHLLWWIFDFLRSEHPDVLLDMQTRLVGDLGEEWVKAGLLNA